MADMRLEGAKLRLVRKLAEGKLTKRMLWRVVSADFHLAELESLPASARGRVEELPKPVQAAAPRSFGSGDHPVPTSKFTTGADLQTAYAAGTLSPVDVAEAIFARIDSGDFGPSRFSPFVAVDREGTLAAAEASAARWKAGEPAGPLDGIPVPVKDEYHVRGLPTRGGTSWRDQPVDEDAFIVERMRKGGALVVGKAHCTENGLNPLGFNAHFDYPRNVHSDGHGAGGSSTGSAVAVGLGMAPVAISTDGGGSIRIPASLNGLYGLKPTLNRVGRGGDIWLGTVGHTGPIGGSTTDLVDLMEVTAALDPDDPFTEFAPDWGQVERTWRPALQRGVEGARIGVLTRMFDMADPAIATACMEALRALESAGAVLEDVDFPLLRIVNAVGPIVIAGEGMANAFDDIRDHQEETGEELRLISALMQNISAQQYLRATRVRNQLRLDLAAVFGRFDLLGLPTTGRLAAPYPKSCDRREVADTTWTAAFTSMNFLGNLTGVPAGTAPVGMSEGLPIGLQLMGDAWDEASVLAGLAAVERIGIGQVPLSKGYRSLLG